MGASMMTSAVLPHSYARHFIALPFGHLICLQDWLGLTVQLLVGHSYSITTKQCICVVLDLVNRPYKCSKTSAFLTSTWFLLTSCSVDKSPFYAGADPFQSEPEFRTLRNAPTFQTEIRLPSFLGAGKAPDLHSRQTVARDTPSSISTTGRRTKASSGRPLKLRRGSGRAGTDLMHPRDGAA